MNKILLVIPFDGYRQVTPMLGVGYIKAYVDRHSKNIVHVHDENFIDDKNGALVKKVEEFNPDFIGISFPSSAVLRVVEMCRLLKKRFPGVHVFAGGYHPTSEPELTLRFIPELDFVVVGEAEHVIANLKKNWEDISNICYVNKSSIYTANAPENISDINLIPFPDRNIYDKRYFMPQKDVISGIYGKTATIMSSRGCPYSCNFCSCKLIQKVVRFNSTDYVLSEIDHILNVIGRIDYLYFLDVMFLAKWSRVEDLCLEFIKHRYNKRFKWAATVAANVVDDKKVKLMKEAGCFYLSFGFESNSDRVLKLINKVATAEHNKRACAICSKYGIFVNSAFLFGIPGENEEDLRKTIDFVKKYYVHFTGLNIMKPLPGSPFYYEFIEKGKIKPSISEWHKISSINIPGTIYNDNVAEETYKKYVEEFNRTIRIKSLVSDLKANWCLKLKYLMK